MLFYFSAMFATFIARTNHQETSMTLLISCCPISSVFVHHASNICIYLFRTSKNSVIPFGGVQQPLRVRDRTVQQKLSNLIQFLDNIFFFHWSISMITEQIVMISWETSTKILKYITLDQLFRPYGAANMVMKLNMFNRRQKIFANHSRNR